MIYLKKIIKKYMGDKLVHERCNRKKENLQSCREHSTQTTDKPTFEQLVQLYRDDEQVDFTIFFTHKDKFFENARSVYETIHVDHIKKIKIMNGLDSAGKTEINIQDNKVEIIISILSTKLGIGANGDVSNYSTQQCEEFADILAHELYHAKSSVDIIKTIGIDEYKSIRDSNKLWIKLAFIIFDEYYACRKNAEQFKSFKSVESVKRIEGTLNYIRGRSKCNHGLDSSIQDLFYAIATVSAFADASIEKDKELLAQANMSKKILQESRSLFNSFYLEAPLNSEKYDHLGCRLEQIYNSYVIC